MMLSQVGTNTPFAVVSSLPTITLACIVSWGLTEGLQYFPAAVQRGRQPHPDTVAVAAHPASASDVAAARTGSSNIQASGTGLRRQAGRSNTRESVASYIGTATSTGERVLGHSDIFDAPLAAAVLRPGQRCRTEPVLSTISDRDTDSDTMHEFTARGKNSSVLDRF